MARYAMVKDDTGIVENVIEWSGDVGEYQPPIGYTLVADPDGAAAIGYTYVDSGFVAPPEEEPPT